jgi:Domain of unknown function (DUF1707)
VAEERREDLRAADSDRQFVAERLQAALNEGRLTLSEYDERLKQTYAARTYGELDRMLDDLPATVTGRDSVIPTQPKVPAIPAPAAQAGPPTRQRGPHWLWAIWGSWLTASVVCTVIYLLSDPGGDFWPKWVIGPWGALSLLSTIGALASGDPQGHVSRRGLDRRDRRQLRRQARRDLRGL